MMPIGLFAVALLLSVILLLGSYVCALAFLQQRDPNDFALTSGSERKDAFQRRIHLDDTSYLNRDVSLTLQTMQVQKRGETPC
jgi:hypothetical protein